jgi:ATP-binding cassette, subfamily F, member 3
VDVLIQALRKFEGTLCLISHDVYFLRQLANQIIHVNHGKVTWYPGDYDYFLHKKSKEEGEEAELFRSEERIEAEHHHSPPVSASAAPKPDASSSAPKPSGFKSKEQKRKEAEERQAAYRREQDVKRKEAVRKNLKESEELLLSELAKPETYQNTARAKDLQQRLGEIQKQLKQLG